MIEPNLNAEAYRNMSPTNRPPVSDRNLQFILIFDEKNAILGGSNMTDRYWNGTVWHYRDISNFNRKNADSAIRTESGVCCGGYLDKDKFLIGEDSGVLQVLGLVEEPEPDAQKIQCLAYACQHDDSLTSLSVFSNNTHVVTGGTDCCLKVWDTTELMAAHSFSFAHVDSVTYVEAQPRNDNVFVSTALDCEALMWDIRQAKPAKTILRKKGCGLTAATWNIALEHNVAVGGVDGSITILDVRKGANDAVLQETNVFSRGIHKLLFNPSTDRFGQLACCCDDTVLKVLDANQELSVIYINDRHEDFVRGLAWYQDDLYSCSWDDTVRKHVMQDGNKQ